MRISTALSVLLLSATGAACSGESPSDPATTLRSSESADDNGVTLYTNGAIWTGAPGAPDASVMVVSNGEITYVGDGANIRVAASETVDLNGRFVMPGFIDNHVHFYEGGMSLASVDLRDAASPDEFTKRIADYASTLKAGRWVLTGNWDHENWGGELPNRAWIDEFTPDIPVFVYRLDGHMALANSVALKLAGIDSGTATPQGGEIVRDANGVPTGILKDAAMALILNVIPEPSDVERLNAFRLAQSHALSLGLTQVHSVTAGPHETFITDALIDAQRTGVMKLRVRHYAPLDSWQQVAERIEGDGLGDDVLRWSGVKAMVDGSLGSTTAWFHDPYSDDPANSGLALIRPKRLGALMGMADGSQLQLAIHAIGDRAIDELIDHFENTAGDQIASRRYRIEHFQHPTPAAIERLAKHGIIASMQPYHAIDDGRWAEQRIGAERIKSTYAFRSVLDAGGILTFGSDWPVAPLSPLLGVYAAVTRRTTDGANPDGWLPQQKISVEEALTAYTASNAYAVFEDARAGTLEPGKRADFIVLSDDPRSIDPVSIPDITVLQTVIDGERVFGSSR